MAEGGKYLNMKYWELLKEENEAVAERHELAMERIGHMKEEATVGEPYRAFFERTVQFIELIEETFQKQMDGTLAAMSQKEATEFNRTLYADILPEAYGKSFANPDYAAKELGENRAELWRLWLLLIARNRLTTPIVFIASYECLL